MNNDRRYLIVVYRWFPSILQVLTIIRPETLIRWHRSGFRCYWRWKSGPSGGRPPIEARLRALIRQMSMDNPCMGLSLSSTKFATRSCFHLLRTAQFCIDGTADSFAWPRFRGKPLEPEGSRRKARGVDGESARRATIVSGHCMLQT